MKWPVSVVRTGILIYFIIPWGNLSWAKVLQQLQKRTLFNKQQQQQPYTRTYHVRTRIIMQNKSEMNIAPALKRLKMLKH